MTDVRKVRPSAGAEWLLGGFSLLRRSPFGLGVLGAIFGLLVTAVTMLGTTSPALLMVQQVVLLLLGPLLVAGMVWAAREVDEGRSANPGHLLRGVQDGKTARLWATLLPQIAATLGVLLLLSVMVGPTQMQALVAAVEQAQGQTQPDPTLFAHLPLGRMFLWGLLALVVGIVAGFFTFTAIPDMMFGEVGAIEAMKRSFRACVANLPALIVFFVLLLISVFAISLAVTLVGMLVGVVAGQVATLVVVQALMMGVLLPVVTGAIYYAWRQLLGGGPDRAAGNGREAAIVEA